MNSEDRCFLARHGLMEMGMPVGPCEGRPVRCHLIKQQVIVRAGGDPGDCRSWVLGCGGITGCSGHHGMLDKSRTLRLPRSAIPVETERFAAELGLEWWLEREYGEALP